jgi:hypothetical protein
VVNRSANYDWLAGVELMAAGIAAATWLQPAAATSLAVGCFVFVDLLYCAAFISVVSDEE